MPSLYEAQILCARVLHVQPSESAEFDLSELAIYVQAARAYEERERAAKEEEWALMARMMGR